MAAHNQIRVLGYLLDNPQIENEGEPGEEKVYLTIRVRNRAVDGYPSSDFQDLIIFMTEQMNTVIEIRLWIN